MSADQHEFPHCETGDLPSHIRAGAASFATGLRCRQNRLRFCNFLEREEIHQQALAVTQNNQFV